MVYEYCPEQNLHAFEPMTHRKQTQKATVYSNRYSEFVILGPFSLRLVKPKILNKLTNRVFSVSSAKNMINKAVNCVIPDH